MSNPPIEKVDLSKLIQSAQMHDTKSSFLDLSQQKKKEPDVLGLGGYKSDYARDESSDDGEDKEEFVTEYIPYVNDVYRTVGDHQFDEAMKKLTKIFNKSARVDSTLNESFHGSPRAKKPEQPNYSKLTERQKSIIGVDLKSFLPQSFDYQNLSSREMNSKVQRSINMNMDLPSPPREKISDDIDEAIREMHEHGVSISTDPKQDRSQKKIKLSERQWSQLVDRLQKKSAKTIYRLKEIEEQRKESIERECTHQPAICTHSRELASGMKSIFDWERIDSELNDRKHRLASEKSKLEKRISAENIFTPKINKSSKNIIRGVETFEAWEKSKKQKLKEHIDTTRMKEVGECTFNPSLSDRSRKIMAKKKLQKSVWDRNYEFEFEKLKKRTQQLEQTSTEISGTPVITEKAKKMKRNAPIGDRLHTLAMESIVKKEIKRKELYGLSPQRSPFSRRSSFDPSRQSLYNDSSSLDDSISLEGLTQLIQAANNRPISAFSNDETSRISKKMKRYSLSSNNKENREDVDSLKSLSSHPEQSWQPEPSYNNFSKSLKTVEAYRKWRAKEVEKE